MNESEKIKSLLNKSKNDVSDAKYCKEIDYNIFSVLEVETKEVIMCRMLADLLNPKGKHGCGDFFLKSFLEVVLEIPEINIDDYMKDVIVEKEFPIEPIKVSNAINGMYEDNDIEKDRDKRIDIVIHNSKHFLPIEVKINSKEKSMQCLQYYDFATRPENDPKTQIYYLTKHGSIPQTSYEKLGEEKCKCISWHAVYQWLEKCINYIPDKHDILEQITQQYLFAIDHFSQSTERKMYMDITNMAFNDNNLDAAISIIKATTTIQDKLIWELFSDIEEFLKEKGLMVVNEKSNNYWKNIKTNFFGEILNENISYKSKVPSVHLKKHKDDEYSLYICIDWRIYAELKKGNDSLGWVYLPEHSKKPSERVPDYYELNKAAISLHDETKRKKFLEDSWKLICHKWQKILQEA